MSPAEEIAARNQAIVHLFYWAATRIKFHILLCFIAFLFEKTLGLAFKSVYQKSEILNCM